jgi:hypothetical protein
MGEQKGLRFASPTVISRVSYAVANQVPFESSIQNQTYSFMAVLIVNMPEGKLFSIKRLRKRGPLIEDDDGLDDEARHQLQEAVEQQPTKQEILQFRWKHDLDEFTDQEVVALMQMDSDMLRGYVISVVRNLQQDEDSEVTVERALWSSSVENYAEQLGEFDELQKSRSML